MKSLTGNSHAKETTTGCAELEPFALRVEGESMAPEFEDGCIIIVDPGHEVVSGVYAVIEYEGEYTFRQLVLAEGKAYLNPINRLFPPQELTGSYEVKGVVTQSTHHRRVRHYEYPDSGDVVRREKVRGKTKHE